jgi:phosphoglycerate kinase
MEFNTLDKGNFKGKRVLLRSDLNSEVSNGKVVEGERIAQSAKTILELQKKGAKVVVLAHQGRPGDADFLSLEQHSKLLNKYVKIKFVKDIVGSKATNEIEKLKNGQAILLENIRYLPDEVKPASNSKVVIYLAPLFDYYVNDAFSVCHRDQASITSLPRLLKSYAGRVLQREVESLEKIKIDDCLFILGGSKPEDNILLMDKKNIIACGIFGHVCLIASGKNLGAQNEFLKDKLGIIPQLKPFVDKVGLPVDLAVKADGKRLDLTIEQFPSQYEVFDIGPKTQEAYVNLIKQAKAIFMKGVAGFTEEEQFCQGTKVLLKAIEESGVFSVLSGGHTTTALKEFGIDQSKIGYISLSGGATIHFLAGKKLPGLEALKNSKK